MKPEEIYKKGILFHHYANTAYPLTPLSFMEYKLKEEQEKKQFLTEEFIKFDKLSLYVHIPFCKQRCKFCEYTVLENSTEDIETEYVELLIKEMNLYSTLLKGKKIVGYDLGGGTPTKLSVENLKKITESITTLFEFEKDTIFSVETTPIIAMQEPDKMKALYDLGYRRISMGIQTVSERLLNELGREGTTSVYEQAVKNIRNAGFDKLNVDLMYGFLNQSDEDFENTVRYSIALKPDFITLYRNRYKGTKIESEAGGVSLYKIIRQYKIAYKILNENQYVANPGKNTFSKVDGDYGTSDYLTKRVIDAVSYVGMGLGAQSFGYDYLAYNEGAASKQMKHYKEKIEMGELPIQDIYSLPLAESIGKMVSVAFYFGFIDLEAFSKRFNLSFLEYFKEEVKFVLDNQLMEVKDSRIYLTERGADYINGIIPLFYSEKSKKDLLDLAARKIKRKEDEEIFLNSYNIEDFKKPSLTCDCIIFRDKNDKKEVLLIKRGEHPYMNSYALPGGFIRPNETVESAAVRELEEETGLQDVELNLVNVFSQPNRDPRGWIISTAYVGKVNEGVDTRCGDDAIDVTWKAIDDLENVELAFDHKDMILSALRLI